MATAGTAKVVIDPRNAVRALKKLERQARIAAKSMAQFYDALEQAQKLGIQIEIVSTQEPKEAHSGNEAKGTTAANDAAEGSSDS